MRIRRKVLIIMAFAGIIQTLALYASTQLIIVDSFGRLEEQYAQENIERTLSALSNELSELSSKTADYAEWNDTYNFVQDANEEYIQENLEAATWANLRVDLILIINTAGQIVFGADYQPDLTATPIPQSLLELLSANDTLWHHPNVDSTITGIVPLAEEPLLIVSRPILTNDHQGPVRGALITGRYLDSEELEYLAQMEHLPLSLSSFSDSETNSDFYAARQSLSKENPVFVQALNADTVAGYALLTDIYEDPFLVLRATMPRDIYKQGQISATYFLAALIITGIVFGLVVMVIQEKQLMSQIDRLATEVRKIGKSKSMSEHLAWDKADEMTLLAGAIDSMMDERLNTIEQVAAMVGHDLRNPLTGISNAAYYLRTKIGSTLVPKATEMLDLIDRDVEYANNIVNDLLEYSRAMKLDLSVKTPKSIMKDALARVTVPASVQVVDFTEDKPEIRVDADKIKRTFVNMIKNAFDAMPNGGKLIVESRKRRGNVEISFTDTGAGIPKETLERLFTPLFTTKARGMGFGLAICKRIMEAHGGKISVDSTVGKGTTFTLTIPVEPKVEGGG